jgi:ABC-type multidrug transport system fused ATPase/permease subunit
MCGIFMLLVQPMLSILTIVATALVFLIFRFFDRRRRMALPVVRERAGQLRTELSQLCLQGPLLESVHDAPEVEARFAEQLDHYRRDAFRSLSSSAWKTPIVITCSSLIAGVFLFLIAVQILRSDASFTVPGAFAFTLCFLGAVVSCVRLQQSYRGLQSVSNAAESLDGFLSIKTESFDSKDLGKIERVSEKIELDHVTVQDSSGRKLLEDVSLTLKPGTLIGIVGSHALQARALSELLMGFGRPVSGRLMFDGKPVTDLDPSSITNTAQWVASNGGIATGTVQDNILRGNASQAGVLNEVLESAKLVEVLQALPDALHTLITPDDDRLRGDAPFRLGIARAAASNASVIVIEEPAKQFDAEAEKQTLAAIQSLVRHDAIVVCLPQRLLTLRSCDQVVMVEDHTVTDTGTHNELLQRNEYYRHLNYLRFNPFQNSEA